MCDTSWLSFNRCFLQWILIHVRFPPQVCWICRASKGSQDLDCCYVNVDPNAAWRGTIGLDPIWEHTPELSKLVGFSPLMISLDLLHIWHLGTGRDPCPICKSFTVFQNKNDSKFSGFSRLHIVNQIISPDCS